MMDKFCKEVVTHSVSSLFSIHHFMLVETLAFHIYWSLATGYSSLILLCIAFLFPIFLTTGLVWGMSGGDLRERVYLLNFSGHFVGVKGAGWISAPKNRTTSRPLHPQFLKRYERVTKSAGHSPANIYKMQAFSWGVPRTWYSIC